MLDVAVIGGGPAALSAAVNCLQRNKTVKIFGRNLDSSLLYTAEKVDNYLGLPECNGEDMLNIFYRHALQKGVEFQECRISQILNMGEHYVINADNEFVEAKKVILATGINKSKSIPGEAEFLGKGVSYCGTCDGMLYKDKTVLVVGENPEGEGDANFLSEICKKVIYIPAYEEIQNLKEKVEVLRTKPISVEGEGKVSALKTAEGDLVCDGIFFIKNTMPMGSIVFGLEMEGNTIKVNRNMETNLPGVYAAGDCIGAPYQIAKAVGEGQVAALNAVMAIRE